MNIETQYCARSGFPLLAFLGRRGGGFARDRLGAGIAPIDHVVARIVQLLGEMQPRLLASGSTHA